MDVVQRVQLLTNIMNVKVAYPKFTMQKNAAGKMEQVATGSFDVSPFSEMELNTIKALLFLDIEENLDGGRLKKKQEEVMSTRELVDKMIVNAEKEEAK